MVMGCGVCRYEKICHAERIITVMVIKTSISSCQLGERTTWLLESNDAVTAVTEVHFLRCHVEESWGA